MSPMADRISSLPDTLVCHILSFLPTKEAVATSVLAKRWRPLWLSLPTLHFNDQNYLQNKGTIFRFLQSVYTVMLLRDASQPIRSFNLECESSLCNTCIVNAWVTAAIQRKVERLSLSLSSTVNLPSCILTSTTLVVLNLKGLTVNSVSSVSFPSLKTLHLRWVHFPERRFLFEVLSSCPVLEDLLVSSVHLTKQTFGGQIETLPKLIKADISECGFPIPIAAFYRAEFLRIEVGWFYFNNRIIRSSFSNLTTFFHLTYLDLILVFHCNWGSLIKLLHRCPKLQILVIDKKHVGTRNSCEESWVYPQSVPNRLSSQLKRCSLKNYDGRQGEVGFAKYIMQNARVLNDLTIQSRSSDSETKFRMIKDLSTCPRISATCELNFL